jgi:hypothetical protein
MEKMHAMLGIVIVIGLVIVTVVLYPSIQQTSSNIYSGKNADSNQACISSGGSPVQPSSSQDSTAPAGSAGSAEYTSTISNPEDTGQEKNYCSDASREIESCEPNDHPVCGWFDQEKVQCDVGPCIRSTFPNECDACKSKTILYWTEGDCPLHN